MMKTVKKGQLRDRKKAAQEGDATPLEKMALPSSPSSPEKPKAD
jgi:hypothetical protein